MKRRLNRLTLAWIAFAVVGAIFCALVALLLSQFLKTIVDCWIIGGFAFAGFLPGLLGAFGLRLAGMLGFAGIVVGLVWGIVDAILKKGLIWPVFVYIDILRILFLALAIGLLIQVFVRPKKADLPFAKKTVRNRSVSTRPRSIFQPKPAKIKPVEDPRIYEI
jgi:MFS family permease